MPNAVTPSARRTRTRTRTGNFVVSLVVASSKVIMMLIMMMMVFSAGTGGRKSGCARPREWIVEAEAAPAPPTAFVPFSDKRAKAEAKTGTGGVRLGSFVGVTAPMSSKWPLSSSMSKTATSITKTTTTNSKCAALALATTGEGPSLRQNDVHDHTCDVLVLGSGPAARALATLLSSPTCPPPSGGAASAAGATVTQETKNGRLDVILADANFDRPWPPNYGVWRDEWDAILALYDSFGRPLDANEEDLMQQDKPMTMGKIGQCLDWEWSKTDCYFGGSFGIPVTERFRVDRPYCRVDKDALRQALTPTSEGGTRRQGRGTNDRNNDDAEYRVLRMNHVSRAIGINVYSPPNTLVHDEDGTTVVLQSKDKSTTETVRTRLVVDCTGHESSIVLKDTRIKSNPPGFQIAYGCLVTVDEASDAQVLKNNVDLNVVESNRASTQIGPYDKEAMTLFDYRTDHFPPSSTQLRDAEQYPTFMYAMPLEGNRIFFEETSLVARPALSFRECKERCHKRLEHLGIRVLDVEEEEFCYIPMGGPLPAKDQRVVGFGGASAMVHPSTGYHLCRAMMSAGDVARAIRTGLGTCYSSSSSSSSSTLVDLDRVAADAYHAMWSPSNIRQRNFAVFGGEFLLKQNVEGLRGFFDGFFRLPMELWAGFLAGWPGLPNNDRHETWYSRMWFGLSFISKLPLPVAADMALSIASYTIKEGTPLPQSVTPFLGEPESYVRPSAMGKAVVGDVAAKAEARIMIKESGLADHVPVAFGDDKGRGISSGSAPRMTLVEQDKDNAERKAEDASEEIEQVVVKKYQ